MRCTNAARMHTRAHTQTTQVLKQREEFQIALYNASPSRKQDPGTELREKDRRKTLFAGDSCKKKLGKKDAITISSSLRVDQWMEKL